MPSTFTDADTDWKSTTPANASKSQIVTRINAIQSALIAAETGIETVTPDVEALKLRSGQFFCSAVSGANGVYECTAPAGVTTIEVTKPGNIFVFVAHADFVPDGVGQMRLKINPENTARLMRDEDEQENIIEGEITAGEIIMVQRTASSRWARLSSSNEQRLLSLVDRVTSLETTVPVTLGEAPLAGSVYQVSGPLSRVEMNAALPVFTIIPQATNVPDGSNQNFLNINGDANDTLFQTLDAMNIPAGALTPGKVYTGKWELNRAYLNLTLAELMAARLDGEVIEKALAATPPARTLLGGDGAAQAARASALPRGTAKTAMDPFNITFPEAYYITEENRWRPITVKPVAGTANLLTSTMRPFTWYTVKVNGGARAAIHLDGPATEIVPKIQVLAGWEGDIPALGVGEERDILEIAGKALFRIMKDDEGFVTLQKVYGPDVVRQDPQTPIAWEYLVITGFQSRADYLARESGLFTVQEHLKEIGQTRNIRFVSAATGSSGIGPGNGSTGDHVNADGSPGPLAIDGIARVNYAINTENVPVTAGKLLFLHKGWVADGNWAGRAVPAPRTFITTVDSYELKLRQYWLNLRNAAYGLSGAADTAMKNMPVRVIPGGSRNSSFGGDIGSQIIVEGQLLAIENDVTNGKDTAIAFDQWQYRSDPEDVHNQDPDHVAAGQPLAEFLENFFFAGANDIQPVYSAASANRTGPRTIELEFRYRFNYPLGNWVPHPLHENRYLPPEGFAVLPGDKTTGRVLPDNTEDSSLETVPVPIEHIQIGAGYTHGDYTTRLYIITMAEDMPAGPVRMTWRFGMMNVFTERYLRNSIGRPLLTGQTELLPAP